jgi:hypothetical protein
MSNSFEPSRRCAVQKPYCVSHAGFTTRMAQRYRSPFSSVHAKKSRCHQSLRAAPTIPYKNCLNNNCDVIIKKSPSNSSLNVFPKHMNFLPEPPRWQHNEASTLSKQQNPHSFLCHICPTPSPFRLERLPNKWFCDCHGGDLRTFYKLQDFHSAEYVVHARWGSTLERSG